MDTTHIYTLAHPLTGTIRYVGKANDLNHRYKHHLRKDEGTKKSRWIKSLAQKGLKPVIELLDIVPSTEWQFWECYWIGQLKAWGLVLYNGDNGGLGSDRLPDSVKRKIASHFLGKSNTALQQPYAQYDLQGNYIKTFESVKAAATAVNGSHGNICRVQGVGLKAYGYLWLKVDGVPPKNIEHNYNADGTIIYSEERRRKIGEKSRLNKRGFRFSDESKHKMSQSRLGKSPANKGISKTDDQKEKDRLACTSRKGVIQYDLSGNELARFGSVKEAEVKTGATRSAIIRMIAGRYRHAGGFKWDWA